MAAKRVSADLSLGDNAVNNPFAGGRFGVDRLEEGDFFVSFRVHNKDAGICRKGIILHCFLGHFGNIRERELGNSLKPVWMIFSHQTIKSLDSFKEKRGHLSRLWIFCNAVEFR